MTGTTALFDKLWVIESLRQGDVKTGKSSDFYEVLDKIYIDSKTSGTLPMVHLECHGSETDIELTSTEIINWDDVREKFIHINIASGLNLIVVMAACYGAHILRMAIKNG